MTSHQYGAGSPTTPVFRKQGDRFVVMAPLSELQNAIALDRPVQVGTRSGASKPTYVWGIGRPFEIDGRDWAYAKIAANSTCDNCGRRTSKLVDGTDMSGLGGLFADRATGTSKAS